MTEYEYLTKEEFLELTGMTELQAEDIAPGDSMTMIDIINLYNSTLHRFGFVVDPSGLFASCNWVNYYKTDGGNYRIDKSTGSASTLPRNEKDIVII